MPLGLALCVWACTLPFVFLLTVPWFGLRVAVITAVVLLAVIGVVCWAVCVGSRRVDTFTTAGRRLEKTIRIAAVPAAVFAWLDDPRNSGWHMSRPSLAMLGGALQVERLSAAPTGVGATYRSWGRVLGYRIDFTTTVVQWVPDREKIWRTIGDPRLVVLGNFEMRFGVEPVEGGTRLTMALDYELPSHGFGRLLGRALATPYARWCLRRMCADAQAALERRVTAQQASASDGQ